MALWGCRKAGFPTGSETNISEYFRIFPNQKKFIPNQWETLRKVNMGVGLLVQLYPHALLCSGGVCGPVGHPFVAINTDHFTAGLPVTYTRAMG